MNAPHIYGFNDSFSVGISSEQVSPDIRKFLGNDLQTIRFRTFQAYVDLKPAPGPPSLQGFAMLPWRDSVNIML